MLMPCGTTRYLYVASLAPSAENLINMNEASRLCQIGMKILIVDDNAAVRRIIRDAVNRIAEEVVECADGEEVLPLYERHHPDVVLMDIRMPKVDGLTATAHLKSHFPEAKVLMVTDVDDEGVRSRALKLGACGYALKHDLTELDEAILRMLREQRRGHS
jgi:DNA-binding NarL/FixJ family response regulator